MSKFRQGITNTINSQKQSLRLLQSSLDMIDPVSSLNDQLDKLKRMQTDTVTMLSNRINFYKSRLDDIYRQQQKYDHTSIMKNGFSVVIDMETNTLVKSAKIFEKCRKLKIIFADGEVVLNGNNIRNDRKKAQS